MVMLESSFGSYFSPVSVPTFVLRGLRGSTATTGLVTVIAEIFVRDLISYFSYFWLKVRNLAAYENHARVTVYVTPSSLYENL